MPQRQQVVDALCATKSLRQLLMTEADNMDQSASCSRQVGAATTLVSIIGAGVGLAGTGGTALPLAIWATRVGTAAGYMSTAASMFESSQSIFAKLSKKETWENLRVELDSPKEMEDADFGISEEFYSILKDIFKELTVYLLEKGAKYLKEEAVRGAVSTMKACARVPSTKAYGKVSKDTFTGRLKQLCKHPTAIVSVVSVFKDMYDLYDVSKDLYHGNPSDAGSFLRGLAAILEKLIRAYEQTLSEGA